MNLLVQVLAYSSAGVGFVTCHKETPASRSVPISNTSSIKCFILPADSARIIARPVRSRLAEDDLKSSHQFDLAIIRVSSIQTFSNGNYSPPSQPVPVSWAPKDQFSDGRLLGMRSMGESCCSWTRVE